METKLNKPFVINDDNVSHYATKIATWIAQQVNTAKRKGVVLGMSGGIDCSVVACLCQLAKVDTHLVMMPYGNDMSNTRSSQHALELIQKFNFAHHTFDIQLAVDALTITNTTFLAQAETVNQALSQANIRPRVRMTYLYQLAQLGSRFVIGTGNMAERTVGYFTKWGDGAADLNPLGMLTKQEVYLLATYLGVPDSIINKKPSAGLWEGQTDEEELGMTYSQIDAFILTGTSGDKNVDILIQHRIAMSVHKFSPVPIFND